MKKILLYSFFLVSIGDLVSIVLSVEILNIACKPLLMVTLGLYYWQAVSREERSKALVVAIAFSFLGDVLLMLQRRSELNFMLGLAAFLVVQVFYILTYRQHQSHTEENKLEGVHKIRFAFPVILAGTGLVVVLYPTLGNLKFPVILYAVILVLMVLNALFRYGHTSNKSFWMVFSGAILFMISDALLAINKFLQPLDNGALLIMVTYVGAQFMIVQGLVKHTK